MMGAVVTGRPVESAWLLHSVEVDDCGNSHGETHMEKSGLAQTSREIRKEQAGGKESQAFKFYTNQLSRHRTSLSGPKYE